MKTNYLLILTALVLMQVFSSCKKEPLKPNNTNLPTNASVQMLASDQTYMRSVIYKSVMLTFGASVGNVNSFKREGTDNMLNGCATVTKDTSVFPYEVTIDFGTGCRLDDGSLVTGVINATYNNDDFTLLNSHAVLNLDSFFIDGNRITGTLTLHNKGINANGNTDFDLNVTNGNLIYGSDGRLVKQNVNWLLEWVANGTPNTDDDYLSFTGTSDGVTSDGDAYVDNIVTPLIISRASNCVHVFIYGVTVAQIVSKPDLTINYGDGTCDSRAEATQGGVTERIDLPMY